MDRKEMVMVKASMANQLDALFGEVRATQGAVAQRERVRARAVQTIRDLEAQLQDALQHDTLKGFKNLGPKTCPFYGARIRSENLWKPLELPPIGHGGRGAPLCLVVDGGLVTVHLERGDPRRLVGEGLVVQDVRDEQLLAEDLEKFVAVLLLVLPEHVKHARALHDRRDGIERLIERLS